MKIKTYAVNCFDAWLNTEGDDISDSYVKYKDHQEVVAALEAKCAALAAELNQKDKRITELEGRAIKFPPKVERDDSDGYWMLKGQRVSAANAAYYNEALKDVALALFAAGIKCEVKGE